jgi:hypothetical protein
VSDDGAALKIFGAIAISNLEFGMYCMPALGLTIGSICGIYVRLKRSWFLRHNYPHYLTPENRQSYINFLRPSDCHSKFLSFGMRYVFCCGALVIFMWSWLIIWLHGNKGPFTQCTTTKPYVIIDKDGNKITDEATTSQFQVGTCSSRSEGFADILMNGQLYPAVFPCTRVMPDAGCKVMMWPAFVLAPIATLVLAYAVWRIWKEPPASNADPT